jgi:protein-disulfide isomerase
MRIFITTLAGAIGGAVLAVAIIFTMAQRGMLPINDRQMQTYLMQHSDIAPAMMGMAQHLDDQKKETAQRQAIAKAGKEALFDPKIAFVTGPVDAKKTLVEFYDYDCPYCRASAPAMKKYYEAHRHDTRFALIEFPIAALHGPSAILAAKASLAARQQPEHYMDFHFGLLGEDGAVTEQMIYDHAQRAGMDVEKLKADMAHPANAKALDESIALARKLGIDGTPTFILNGKMRPGMVDEASLADEMKS